MGGRAEWEDRNTEQEPLRVSTAEGERLTEWSHINAKLELKVRSLEQNQHAAPAVGLAHADPAVGT